MVWLLSGLAVQKKISVELTNIFAIKILAYDRKLFRKQSLEFFFYAPSYFRLKFFGTAKLHFLKKTGATPFKNHSSLQRRAKIIFKGDLQQVVLEKKKEKKIGQNGVCTKERKPASMSYRTGLRQDYHDTCARGGIS